MAIINDINNPINAEPTNSIKKFPKSSRGFPLNDPLFSLTAILKNTHT
jgi:hypothetical protein